MMENQRGNCKKCNLPVMIDDGYELESNSFFPKYLCDECAENSGIDTSTDF